MTNATRTIITSDGKTKIYGWSKDGDQIIVIMTPSINGLDIAHIKKGGSWLFFDGQRL